MDADDLTLLVESAEHILAGGDVERLAAELVGAGLADLFEQPDIAAALLTMQGSLTARSTLLDLILSGKDYHDGLRVVLPLPGSQRPPGQGDAATIRVDGVVLVPENAARYLVHTGSRALRVPAGSVDSVPVTGFDPGLGMARVRGELDAAEAEPVGERHWDRVVNAGCGAVAHELVGVGQRALDLTIGQVSARHQFGKPLSAAQAVRHRLVDAHVGLEAARAVLDSVGAAADDEIGALTVKACAGRAALDTVAAAQQLCGAIGFTAEHPLHHLVRRAHLLDSLFGCAEDLELEIGVLLAARGTSYRLAAL